MNRSWIPAALLLGLAAFIMLPARDAAARSHISTGQELYEACKVLAEYSLNPQGRTPSPGLRCRQFIEGYFRSAKYVRESDTDKQALGLPLAPTDCAPVADTNSYDQLAGKVVRNGEWHPELLDQPAVYLARAAFGSKPPC